MAVEHDPKEAEMRIDWLRLVVVLLGVMVIILFAFAAGIETGRSSP